MKTPLAELSLGRWNEHAMSLSRTEVRPTRDVGDRHEAVFEVSWTIPWQ